MKPSLTASLKLTIDSAEDAAPIPLTAGALRDAPQPSQNRASAGLSLPHCGHFMSDVDKADVPHEPQNDASALSVAPQLVQYRASVIELPP